jgi:hypothetical protein
MSTYVQFKVLSDKQKEKYGAIVVAAFVLIAVSWVIQLAILGATS